MVKTFHKACDYHGFPASLLTDNGAVFTGAPRAGKVLLESELERLGIVFKNSRPYHPQTCGKVERLHQTLKRYLAKQTPAKTREQLQDQLDAFALGRAHKGRAVTILVAAVDVRVIDDQGEVIRQLTLDPSRNYQPLGPT